MYFQLKKKVFEANMLLAKYQLAIHTWGNVSARSDDQKVFAIKPSGVPYDKMQIEDIVVLDMDGKIIEGKCKPSSDTPTHLHLYQNEPRIQAIVHTHSPFAVAFAQSEQSILCFGTTHADYFWKKIYCTRALKESEITKDYELNTGKVIVETFLHQKINPTTNPAILVNKHGPFIYSHKSPEDAVNNAKTLEEVAKMAFYTLALNPQAKKAPNFLLKKHYERKHGKKAYYGQ